MRLLDLPSGAGCYRCIYMDPPWKYQDQTARGAAARHYPTMTLEELKRLPVPELAHPDGAFFWIWATWPKIRDQIPHELIMHWGLRWVGEVVWDKQRIGPGRWLRSKAEVLILAVAGKPERTFQMKRQGNILLALDEEPVVSFARSQKHSAKPAVFRSLVERLSPGPRIELFAREAAPRWDCWGNEAPSEPAELPVAAEPFPGSMGEPGREGELDLPSPA